MSEVKPPIEGQKFETHQHWVNKASSWLTCHPEYRNTEHGDTKGWRGHHFTAMCFDSKGRRVRNGGDFAKSNDEGAFPVWWVWPDQIPQMASEIERLTAENNELRTGEYLVKVIEERERLRKELEDANACLALIRYAMQTKVVEINA